MTPPAVWSAAYRPLKPRGLLVQLAALIVVEVLLWNSYATQEARFHWATHFLVGLTAAALLNLGWLTLKGAPARGLILWVIGLHLFAMAPDLVFPAGVPHAGWMDIFLGHISSHHLPGGDAAWLVIALGTSGLFAIALAGWLAARRDEARTGLPPGIGIGGAALVRAQAHPGTTPLGHTRLGPEGAPDVLLLHGLGASQAIWRRVAELLATKGKRVVAPDLLGFGMSRRIGTRFELADQVAAVRELLRHSGAARVTVAAHSFGCTVAVGLAQTAPEQVERLVLVSPPVFRDGPDARRRLSQRGWLARQVVQGTPVADLACGAMCLLRRPAARIVTWRSGRLPHAVARDGVEHVWPAYRDALRTVLDDNPLPEAIGQPRRPTVVILGRHDAQTPPNDVLDYPHDRVDVIELDGDHLLPLQAPHSIAAAIAADCN